MQQCDVGRPNGSKAIITADYGELYFVLTWTDLFGASIKECQLGLQKKKVEGSQHWIWYARKGSQEQLDVVLKSLMVDKPLRDAYVYK